MYSHMCQWSEDVWSFQAVVVQAHIAKHPLYSAENSVIDTVYLNNLTNMAKYVHKFSLKIQIFLMNLLIAFVVQFDIMVHAHSFVVSLPLHAP
jgi:hypothetical protein